MTPSYQQTPFWELGVAGQCEQEPSRGALSGFHEAGIAPARRMPNLPGAYRRGSNNEQTALKMHLVGQLSNPSTPLVAVFEALPTKLLQPTGRHEPQLETGRLGNGVVQRAVVKVLGAAQRPMRVLEVHPVVEGLLGHPVSKDSVSWCLAAGARVAPPRFERVSYGTYRLMDR